MTHYIAEKSIFAANKRLWKLSMDRQKKNHPEDVCYDDFRNVSIIKIIKLARYLLEKFIFIAN